MAIAEGSHPFPFRTRKLSLQAPMVLGPSGPGRVGRRRISHTSPATERGSCFFWPRTRCAEVRRRPRAVTWSFRFVSERRRTEEFFVMPNDRPRNSRGSSGSGRGSGPRGRPGRPAKPGGKRSAAQEVPRKSGGQSGRTASKGGQGPRRDDRRDGPRRDDRRDGSHRDEERVIVIWPARSNGVVSLAAALAIWTTRTH